MERRAPGHPVSAGGTGAQLGDYLPGVRVFPAVAQFLKVPRQVIFLGQAGDVGGEFLGCFRVLGGLFTVQENWLN